MGRSRSRSSGCGTLPLVLFVVFLACKLAGVIDWSWWWVTAPLWLPPALVVAALLLLALTGVGAYKLVSRGAKTWVGRSGMKVWSTRLGSTHTDPARGQGDVVIDAEGAEVVVEAEGAEVSTTGADARTADERRSPGRQQGLPEAAADEAADGSPSGGDRPTA